VRPAHKEFKASNEYKEMWVLLDLPDPKALQEQTELTERMEPTERQVQLAQLEHNEFNEYKE
jgi:hypothetical protein